MKKVSNVIIRGLKYDLYDIPGKYHTNNNTLWVKKDKDIFNDDDDYIPWDDKKTNRRCWKITINQGNSISYKKNDYDFNKCINGHTSLDISLNETNVYEMSCENLNDALFKIQQTIDKLDKLPIELDDFKKDIGRKIFYKKLPAVIVNRFVNGNMLIKPDCEENEVNRWWKMFADPWYSELEWELLENWKEDNCVSVDILSNNIYWSRNDRVIKINNIKREIKKGT